MSYWLSILLRLAAAGLKSRRNLLLENVARPDIDAFEAMMMREDCEKGFFGSFDYSSGALQEIESFFKRSHKVIVALTVQEILDAHIAKKLV
jgi:hypothetical protein